MRGQDVLQISVLGQGGYKEVKMRFNSIGTRILEVCERSECTADQCFWSRGCKGVK